MLLNVIPATLTRLRLRVRYRVGSACHNSVTQVQARDKAAAAVFMGEGPGSSGLHVTLLPCLYVGAVNYSTMKTAS